MNTMNTTPDVDSLFERWRAASESGKPVSAEILCRDHPGLLAELALRIGAWQRLNQSWSSENVDSNYQGDLDDSPLTGRESVPLEVCYRDLSHLATGGLGVVYRASDPMLARSVAIKTIRSAHADADSRERFFSEARITAGLDHPGIVPVYGMGRTENGDAFYSMRLINGMTMEAAISSLHSGPGKSPDYGGRAFHDMLSRLAAVCKTVAYAHSRGILHCDLKPRNILFGKYGETIVLDWGAARAVQREVADRATGEKTLAVIDNPGMSDSERTRISGTLPYMSPEQASGQTDLTRQSDVYSLGVTLYVMLCGSPPCAGKSTSEIRQQIIRGEYEKPSRRQRRVSRAIEAICLRAMDLDPARRYSSALDMAEDIERFLADETIEWFREPLDRRLARWARRNRQAVLAGCVTAAVVTLILFGLVSRNAW
jgi:eukaryotic-like serine/threonine-protein kinase